jgi:uncharacterized protein YjeT (DUF2065 family)
MGISSGMVRWGGLAGLAAGVVFLLSGILTFVAPPQGFQVPLATTWSRSS